jgi:hypothetical protein
MKDHLKTKALPAAKKDLMLAPNPKALQVKMPKKVLKKAVKAAADAIAADVAEVASVDAIVRLEKVASKT